jgi:hypothetical protein
MMLLLLNKPQEAALVQSPHLMNLCTDSVPPNLHLCTSALPYLQLLCTSTHLCTSAPQHFFANSAAPPHLNYSAAPLLHHLCTFAPLHLCITSALPLHYLCITSALPLHYLFTSAPWHLLWL